MNFIRSFFGLMLLVMSTSVWAGEVICGGSREDMIQAVNKLNEKLVQRLGWQTSRPVFHTSIDSNKQPVYLICVSLVK